MALISKASLLMVPSTYEPGTLFNVLPSGNRAPDSTDQNSGYDQTRADFDFDRGSNAAATRIGSDGLLKKYRENKLLRSNQFDTTWDDSSVITLTSGQEDKDGGTTAWKLAKGAASSFLYQSITTSGVNTFSLYAKADTTNWIMMQVSGIASVRTFFDLSNGVLGSSLSNVINATIESVGNGWYRCSFTYNGNAGAVRVFPADGNNDTSGTSGSIYIQSAQLETGLVATDVLTSGATTAKAGVLIDLPRINYDANGENGALLLEPSRLQMLGYSEYANEWDVDSNVTTTINAATSPEGVLNAVKLEGLTTSANNQIFRFIGSNTGVSVVGEPFSCSLYIKPVNPNDVGKNIELSIQRTAGDYEGLSQTFEIDSADWKRYDLSYTFTGAGLGNQTGVTFKVLRNSTTIDDIYCFGAQCEEASYPSSYIPNHGESGGVTRAADVCNNGGSAESINSVEGVLYAEISALVNGGENRVMSISDGSYQNSVRIQLYTNTNEIEMRIVTANAVQALERVAITNTLNFNKIAVKYKANDFQLWVNGSKLRFDTNGTMPAANTFDTFNFDDGDGNGDFYGNVKQVAVFNEALSDSELATLTTL